MQTFPPEMTELNLHKTPTPAALTLRGSFSYAFLPSSSVRM